MCGITGFNWNDKELIKKMTDYISHRGPDGEGFFNDDIVSLGHRRLSIIDLSEKGKQPMSDENGSLWITFNGEIYNYKDIRKDLEQRGCKFNSKTDTEVIIYAYKQYGFECLNRLRGDFAFCIYDVDKKLFFLARDRLGVKPLYFYHKDNKFIFASEIKAILKNPEIIKKINIEVLNKFISFRYSFGETTILEDVSKVLPGQYLIYDIKNDFLIKKIYWDVETNTYLKANENFFAKKITELLEESVKLQLMSDVSLGAYLSGGIDSASIVAMMSKHSQNIKTFSVGFGYEEETDELKYAKLVSEKFNTDHKEFIVTSDLMKNFPKLVWHCDEPLADPAMLPVFLLSEQAKKHATVVLTGDGGDELFAGYEQNKLLKLKNNFRFIPFKKQMFSVGINLFPKSHINKFFKYAESLGDQGIERAKKFLSAKDLSKSYEELVCLFDDDEKKQLIKENKIFSLSKYFNKSRILLNKILYFELKTQLPDNMLLKTDKMAMAFGIEARVPILDYRLTEFSFKIPPKLKLKGMNEKFILKKAMRDILPKEILLRKKQRFYVPIDKWLKNDLQPLVDEILNDTAIKQQGYFNYEYIKRIREKFDNSPLFYSRQIWNLLTFQTWHKIFIENQYD